MVWLLFVISAQLGSSSQAMAVVTSMGAGRVADVVLTTREVQMTHLIEQALFEVKDSKPIQSQIRVSKARSPEFVKEATTALLEAAIDIESTSYRKKEIQISNDEIKRRSRLAMTRLRGVKEWRDLNPEMYEVESLIRRKLQAKQYIQFKVDSSTIPISDQEAEEYFNANRLKFENLPFQSFKETIKSYLTRQQLDRRMKDWFELLQTKYQIRNYLAE